MDMLIFLGDATYARLCALAVYYERTPEDLAQAILAHNIWNDGALQAPGGQPEFADGKESKGCSEM